ncbi:MAG: acylphosphatase [Deltaproteobacteria bacterium SG8_13]|nr:MAG: acylphosphatase [Deltaproteobacteria bacterium SG8_13]
MADKVRAHAIITGIVQGVFFRIETQRAAELRGVAGWVRNKRDGSVEAVFEGDSKDVNAVLDWCRQGPARAVVHDVVVEWQEYTGEYGGFDVTY